MNTLNNFFINKSPLNLITIINSSSNKNISNRKIDFDAKTNNYQIKKINPKKLISRNIINTNEKSIKVNKSNYFTSYIKDKSCAPLKKKYLKTKLRNKSKYDDNNNSTLNRSRKEKNSSPNNKININTTMRNKEFNKIFLFETLNNEKSRAKETIKINIKNINKILIKNKSMDKYNNEYPGNNKQSSSLNDFNINNIIHFNNNTERKLEKENKYIKSTKLIKAQEKWKRNYLATEIQKTFRGFIYRKKFWSNYIKNKKDNNIYIKKLPKKKSIGIFKIKINHKNKTITKNKILEKINNINETRKELLNSRNYSTQQFPKIKEIIIRRRRNSPVVNLNLNNCSINGYTNNYTIFKNNSFFKNYDIKINSYRNDSIHKYWEAKQNLDIKLKKAWNHWADISVKNKIIKGFIHLRMKDNNNIKNDETYSSTNPYSEEKKNINVRKNAKLFYVKK